MRSPFSEGLQRAAAMLQQIVSTAITLTVLSIYYIAKKKIEEVKRDQERKLQRLVQRECVREVYRQGSRLGQRIAHNLERQYELRHTNSTRQPRHRGRRTRPQQANEHTCEQPQSPPSYESATTESDLRNSEEISVPILVTGTVVNQP